MCATLPMPHLLCLQNSQYLGADSALALLCGDGSVAMGFFINGKIAFGTNQTFPECSHLPYPYGFERSLGSYTKHTANALCYAIEVLAPIYKHKRVILTGSCFADHPEVIVKAQQTLRRSSNSVLNKIQLEYWPLEIEQYREELVCLRFTELIAHLKSEKRIIATWFAEWEQQRGL